LWIYLIYLDIASSARPSRGPGVHRAETFDGRRSLGPNERCAFGSRIEAGPVVHAPRFHAEDTERHNPAHASHLGSSTDPGSPRVTQEQYPRTTCSPTRAPSSKRGSRPWCVSSMCDVLSATLPSTGLLRATGRTEPRTRGDEGVGSARRRCPCGAHRRMRSTAARRVHLRVGSPAGLPSSLHQGERVGVQQARVGLPRRSPRRDRMHPRSCLPVHGSATPGRLPGRKLGSRGPVLGREPGHARAGTCERAGPTDRRVHLGRMLDRLLPRPFASHHGVSRERARNLFVWRRLTATASTRTG
jgi:hypothetical protein